jgi:hypothetical protein
MFVANGTRGAARGRHATGLKDTSLRQQREEARCECATPHICAPQKGKRRKSCEVQKVGSGGMPHLVDRRGAFKLDLGRPDADGASRIEIWSDQNTGQILGTAASRTPIHAEEGPNGRGG